MPSGSCSATIVATSVTNHCAPAGVPHKRDPLGLSDIGEVLTSKPACSYGRVRQLVLSQKPGFGELRTQVRAVQHLQFVNPVKVNAAASELCQDLRFWTGVGLPLRFDAIEKQVAQRMEFRTTIER